MAMFYYMIGNNDWFVTSKHNTSILKPKLSDSEEMRSAKRLRIKSLQKAQEHPEGIVSIFASLFNSIH